MTFIEAGYVQVAKGDLREALALTLAARADLEGDEAAGADYHAGFLSERLGDLAEAKTFFERYLASGTGSFQARRSAEDMVESTKRRLAAPSSAKGQDQEQQ